LSRQDWESAALFGVLSAQLSAWLGASWSASIALMGFVLGLGLLRFTSPAWAEPPHARPEPSLPEPAQSPKSEPPREPDNGPTRPAIETWLIDTSAIIDGRVLALFEAGLRPAQVIVPREVLNELHHLADKSTKLRRERGRRGQEIAARLRELCPQEWTEVSLQDGPVDEQLVALGRQVHARLVSLDRGLLDRARAEGLRVLAIQDLAAAMLQPLLPGTRLELDLVKKGEGKDQAVGYGSDGTMVVVDGASTRMGEKVAVEVKSSIRTRNGTLVFARLSEEQKGEAE
jgi:uncharacterized protein YacL